MYPKQDIPNIRKVIRAGDPVKVILCIIFMNEGDSVDAAEEQQLFQILYTFCITELCVTHETISLILYLALLWPHVGFVPMATESRLAPVPGPVPHSYPVSKELQLPEAFTSSATHFTPIILTSEGEIGEESRNLEAAAEG